AQPSRQSVGRVARRHRRVACATHAKQFQPVRFPGTEDFVSTLDTRGAHHCPCRSGTQGKAGLFGALRRRTIRKNEAKSYGIWAALPHLAKVRNGSTESTEILFKKTLTQTGGSGNLSPHTE